MTIIDRVNELSKYYDKKTDTYYFKDRNGKYMNIKFNFDLYTTSGIVAHNIIAKNITAGYIGGLNIKAHNINSGDMRVFNISANNICAYNISANNIQAMDISAHDITAADILAFDIKSLVNINANNIKFYALCIAYHDINCATIHGMRTHSRYFVLDGKIIVREQYWDGK